MKSSFFSTPIYIEEDNSWLELLNKSSDKYIEESIQRKKHKFFNNKDFGFAHLSEKLTTDINFFEFMKYICKKSYSILDEQGFNLKDYSLVIRDLWVQEFSKDGGGNHNTHTHWNAHISGFYFLKCSEKTSFPIFHDPRPSKLMVQLPEKNTSSITDASDKVVIKPSPGTFIFFNSYLGHEFCVDPGLDPFRFIHFNIQAFPKDLIANNVKKI
jgi:uncharacterized protein (TIGR02466 family)